MSEFFLFKALVLAAIGRAHELDDDMCGLVVSSRAEEDIISVTKNFPEKKWAPCWL